MIHISCAYYWPWRATNTVIENPKSQKLYVTQFAKTRHNNAFLEIQIFASVSSIYLKLCSVAIPMYIANTFRVTRLDSKRSNTLALYAFLWQLILHVFNYMIITYGYFNIQSWDINHSIQYEMAILIMYRFLRKYKG